MSASSADSWTETEQGTDFLARLNLPATIIQPPQVRDILYREGVTDDRKLKILIFALVPGEPEHGFEDEEIQGLPHAVFTKLLDLLNHYRGNFLRNASKRLSAIYRVLCGEDIATKYMFEDNEESVLNETSDALELVDRLLSVS